MIQGKSYNRGNTKKKAHKDINPKYWQHSHTQSIGEKRIQEYLNKHRIFHLTEARFNDLINPETNQNLMMDFWLPNQNLVIEYSGTQHTEYTKKFHGDRKLEKFEKQKIKDAIKKEYCLTKGIKLLVLTYENWDELENIIGKNIKIKNGNN